MIKFIYGGKKYAIGWKHDKKLIKGEKIRRSKPSRHSICFISTVDSMGTLTEMDKVSVTRLSTDPPCLDAARRFSMIKLLGKVAHGPSNKEFRTIVWLAYRTRPRPKTIPKVKDSKKVAERSDESLHAHY